MNVGETSGASMIDSLLRRRAIPVTMMLAALFASGCGKSPPEQPTFSPLMESERLLYDDAGGITDSLRMVIRTEDTWRDMWERATSRRASPPSRPQVDFETEMVLLVSAGRMTVGDQIRVDSLKIWDEPIVGGGDEEVLSVLVRTIRGCGEVDRDVWPLEIVRVGRFDGRITWIEKPEGSPEC